MEPCKFHIGYRATIKWPSYHAIVTSRTLRMIFLLFIIKASFLASVSAHPNIDEQPWTSLQIKDNIENMIMDPQDGSLIVVADSHIYKYSPELKLLSNIQVSTSWFNARQTQADNVTNKVLTIWHSEKGNRLLFSCWRSYKDGLINCCLNNIDDIEKRSPLRWPEDSKGLSIDLESRVQAVNKDDNLLMLSDRSSLLDNDSMNISAHHFPAMGRFNVIQSDILKPMTLLQYNSQLKKSKIVDDYVYLFNHNEYNYIILNTIHKSRNGREDTYNVKIARVCSEDIDLISYTEISVVCHETKPGNTYASVAYFDSDNSSQEPVLYIVFETHRDHGAKKTLVTSSICTYSIDTINNGFRYVNAACHGINANFNRLTKFTEEDPDSPIPCERSRAIDDEGYCTSTINPFIDGTSFFIERDNRYFNLDAFNLSSINFLHVTNQGKESKPVLFIGSNNGYLTKFSSEGERLFTVDFDRRNIHYGGDSSIDRRSLKTDSYSYVANSRNILAVTSGGQAHQLKLNTCSYYTTCNSCLSKKDPLNCSWCGDSCTNEQCSLNKLVDCPPKIKRFMPTSGPISGGTRLQIEGESFGSKEGEVIVRVGDENCPVIRETQTDHIIECFVSRVDHATKPMINVTVRDTSTAVWSIGSAKSSGLFSYVPVKVYGMHQNVDGLKTDKPVVVHVFGENLDVGSSRKVLLGNVNCDIVGTSKDNITCQAPAQRLLTRSPTNAPSNSSSAEVYPLKVIIDNNLQPLNHRHLHLGYNLTTHFDYPIESPPPAATTSFPLITEKMGESSAISYYIIMALVFITLIALILTFLLRNDLIPQVKKIPCLRLEKDNDNKVTFNNRRNSTSQPQVELPIPRSSPIEGDVPDSEYPLVMNEKSLQKRLMQDGIWIDRNQLNLGHLLGSGQFGKVYKGFLKTSNPGKEINVAVKTLHNNGSREDNDAFLEEGTMMKDFDHENVLALIGVTLDLNGSPMVITPFMLYGDLRSYIREEESSPNVGELINFGIQVARGMAYLAEHNFVHRDLAARNCMLDENLTVKVADFGLARGLFYSDYYKSYNMQVKLPLKWMALESITRQRYTTKSDVWSYGVLLWELMTRGVVPYPDVQPGELVKYLDEGKRMLRPTYCPIALYKIMLSCWDRSPENRPTFKDLVHLVSDVITQLPKVNGQLNVV